MADNKVLIELQVIQKGDSLSIIQKDTDKLAKTQDKLAKKQKKVGKSSETVIKGQKGIHQANLSSSKGFSKMNQMLDGGGGSSGLVAAYATLAANVFAATAAFNAFRSAAAFEQLGEGFTFMANQAGRTMDLVVDRLKEVSGQALSTEQALQGASLAISAGFSTDDLEKLTKVAKGASLALGRNLSDAFDRLTRGAIKLEPEILDELGIMVRLDDATDAYAATIGKTSDQLTQFQRQQAFINAINEQGIEKYGELADAVDVNPYDQLAAAFSDLTVKGLGVLNHVLIPFAKLFASNNSTMIGGLILFGSTILTTMIPALGNMAKTASEAADNAEGLAKANLNAVDVDVTSAQKALAAGKKQSKTVKDLQKTIAEGGDVKKQALITERNLERQLSTAKNQFRTAEAAGDQEAMARATARQAQIQAEITATKTLGTADTVRLTSAAAAEAARVVAIQARIVSEAAALISQVGFIAGLKIATAAAKEYAATITVAATSTGFLSVAMSKAGKMLKVAAVAMKLYGMTFLKALPGFGQFLLIAGLLVTAIGFVVKKFRTQSQATENLSKVTGTLQEKFDQLNTTIDNMGNSASRGNIRIRQLKMSAGILTEVSTAIENINKEAAAASEEAMKPRFQFSGGSYYGSDTTPTVPDASVGKAASKKVQKDGFEALQENLEEIVGDTTQASLAIREQLAKVFGEADKPLSPQGLIGFIRDLKFSDYDTVIKGVQDATTTITEADQELTNLKKSLSEGEQIFSKFFANAAKATEFDGMVDQFKTMEESLAALSDEPEALKELFEGSGKNLQKFRKEGESIEAFSARIPLLSTAFKDLQKKTQNLQVDLKKLNTEAKSLGSISNLSAEGMTVFLEKQNEAVNKTVELNNAQIKTYEGIEETQEILDKIKTLRTANLELAVRLKSVLEIQLASERTGLEIDDKRLKSKRQIAKLAEDNLLIEEQIRKLSTTGTTNLDPAKEQRLKVAAARAETAFAIKRAKVERDLIKNKRDAKLEEIMQDRLLGNMSFDTWMASWMATQREANLEIEVSNAILKNTKEKNKLVEAQGMASGDPLTIAKTIKDNVTGTLDTMASRMILVKSTMQPLIDGFNELGEEGQAIGNAIAKMLEFTGLIATMSEDIKELTASLNDLGDSKDIFEGMSNQKFATTIVAMNALGSAIGALGAAMAASSANRIAIVDREIAAEKKLRGNSKAGQAKIEALEKRKTMMQKKAFDTDKKMKIAQTLIATATSAAIAFAVIMAATAGLGGGVATAVAGAIIAMGAKQISLISGLTFDGGSASLGGGTPQEISIGSRSNSVDVSQGVTGGENSFLRGDQGVGSNANNFVPGGASGMRKGYTTGGEILVGEQGPEVIRAPGGSSVIPNDARGGTTNANFTINAVDAAGVEEVLMKQRGNIIGMIREAAHEHGEEFIEAVNPNAYGIPMEK